MKMWNDASVLGNSNLFFHHFTLHHFTRFLNDQTSNAMFIDFRHLTPLATRFSVAADFMISGKLSTRILPPNIEKP